MQIRCTYPVRPEPSFDEVIRVNVLEGSHIPLLQDNKRIGYVDIKGVNISRDVYKGSDVEITLQMSESRELVVSVFLTIEDQEIKKALKIK